MRESAVNDNEAIWPGDPLPESRFFPPSERCPAPQHYTSTDGDSTEREVAEFIGALVRVTQPEYVVELGAAFGETTEHIVHALKRNGHGTLTTLEVDPVRAEYVRDRLFAYENWELAEASSLEWLPPPDAPPIGLLFSDTLRDIRVQELLRFLPFMRPCGLAAVHDSGWDMGPLRGWIENSLVKPGLARAVDFPTARGLTLLELNPGNGD
jgi:predicted O-methyltransferase YrrM